MTKTHELDQDRDHDDLRRNTTSGVAPGRGTRVQDLVGPTGPMPSGILMRKARDENGVEAGAVDAVSRASSSSSGHALPDDLRSKFESSLGADLSAVRVHTGEASHAANDAVGARAYAVGQDIHFGAGQYDPSSASGEHLIAHEVAHTVQQAGGAARKPMFKLDVSTPGDAHEIEADRAADAMVLGGPARALGASGMSRKVMRDAAVRTGANIVNDPLDDGSGSQTPANDMPYETVTGYGEEAARINQAEIEKAGGMDIFGGASTVGDRSAASKMLSEVNSGVGELNQASNDDTSSNVPAKLDANNNAARVLTDYLNAAGKQDGLQAMFADQLGQLNSQSARLEAMYGAARKSFGVKDDAAPDATFDLTSSKASNIAIAGGGSGDVTGRLREQGIAGPQATPAKLDVVKQDIDHCRAQITAVSKELGQIPKDMGTALRDVAACQQEVIGAATMVQLPPAKRDDTDEQKAQRQNIAAAKEKFQSCVTAINTAASIALKGIGMIPSGSMGGNSMKGFSEDAASGDNTNIQGSKSGAFRHDSDAFSSGGGVDGADVKGMSGNKASGAVEGGLGPAGGMKVDDSGTGEKFGFVEGLADALTDYSAKVSTANGMISSISDDVTKRAASAAVSSMNGIKARLQNAVTTVQQKRAQFEQKKAELRAAVQKLNEKIRGNTSADKKSGDLGMVVAFQAEATIYLGQCDTALEIGGSERKVAKQINPNVQGSGSAPVLAEGSAGAQAVGITNSSQSPGCAKFYRASKGSRTSGFGEERPFWNYQNYSVTITSNNQGASDTMMDGYLKDVEADRKKVEGFVSTLKRVTGL